MHEDPREITVQLRMSDELDIEDYLQAIFSSLYEDENKTRLRPMIRTDANYLLGCANTLRDLIDDLEDMANELKSRRNKAIVKVQTRKWSEATDKIESDARLLLDRGIEDYMGMLHWRV